MITKKKIFKHKKKLQIKLKSNVNVNTKGKQFLFGYIYNTTFIYMLVQLHFKPNKIRYHKIVNIYKFRKRSINFHRLHRYNTKAYINVLRVFILLKKNNQQNKIKKKILFEAFIYYTQIMHICNIARESRIIHKKYIYSHLT